VAIGVIERLYPKEGGRSLLTPEKAAAIAQSIAEGMSFGGACKLHGVYPQVGWGWLKKAAEMFARVEQGEELVYESDRLYLDFAFQVAIALGEAERFYSSAVRDAVSGKRRVDGNLALRVLQTRFDEWNAKQRVEVDSRAEVTVSQGNAMLDALTSKERIEAVHRIYGELGIERVPGVTPINHAEPGEVEKPPQQQVAELKQKMMDETFNTVLWGLLKAGPRERKEVTETMQKVTGFSPERVHAKIEQLRNRRQVIEQHKGGRQPIAYLKLP
jgi:hypothetical protein